MVCNTAVFYDIENLMCLFTVKNNTILQLDEIYRRILEVEGVNGVSVQKAYTDWAVQINRNLRHYVLQIGIEPVQIFNTNQNDKVKNAADVSLIIDAVELLAKRPDIENYVIVSGDGIFAFLAKKLHEHGKRVIGCGFSRNTNSIFRNACDYFITLEKTDRALTATSSKSPLAAPSSAVSTIAEDIPEEQAETAAIEDKPEKTAPVAKVEAPAAVTVPSLEKSVPVPASQPEKTVSVKQQKAKRIPGKFPKTKLSEILIDAEIPVWKNTSDPNGALLIIRDVVNVLFQKGIDESSDLEISVLKTYVDYYVQGFKVSPYKFKRFGEFIRFFLTGSPYCLYKAEGTTIKVAHRGSPGVKGSVMADMRGLQITLENGGICHSIFDIPDHVPFKFTILEMSKPTAKKQAKPLENVPPENKASLSSVEAEKAVKVVKAAQATGTDNEFAVQNEDQEEFQVDNRTAQTAPPEETDLTIEDTGGTPEGVEAAPEADSNPAQAVDAPVEKTDKPSTGIPIPVQSNKAESEAPYGQDDITGEGSIRKWIKASFMRLSLDSALSTVEVRRLVTADYSQKVFGIKTPVFKEIESRSNLNEQRMVNGKVKYWKESFWFNGKTYLIYKEWTAVLHKERFSAWLKDIQLKTNRE